MFTIVIMVLPISLSEERLKNSNLEMMLIFDGIKPERSFALKSNHSQIFIAQNLLRDCSFLLPLLIITLVTLCYCVICFAGSQTYSWATQLKKTMIC